MLLCCKAVYGYVKDYEQNGDTLEYDHYDYRENTRDNITIRLNTR